MRSYNPDSEEAQKDARDNARATFEAMVESGISCQRAFDNVSQGHGFPYVPDLSPWFNSVERLLRLEQIAQSWKGTPFMANAAVKGHGVSCQKLVTAIYKECAFLPPEFECDDGPMSWSRAQKESLIEAFMAKQGKYFATLDFPQHKPRPGDMIGIKVDGCIHHSGIVFRTSPEVSFVHIYIKQTVQFSNVYDATYWNRIGKIWRPIQTIFLNLCTETKIPHNSNPTASRTK